MLFKKIENKTVVWIENQNSYVITDNMTASIIDKITARIDLRQIAREMANELSVPVSTSLEFVYQLKRRFGNNLKKECHVSPPKARELGQLNEHYYVKYYCFNDILFAINFSNKELFNCIHYKFAHLECNENSQCTHHFSILAQKDQITLFHNQIDIGSWHPNEAHLFQGKLFMQILEVIYKKPKEEWLAIFHGSAIVKNNKAMLLLGDSGHGKSTALAILQSYGYSCLADDFVPLCNQQNIYAFPAAISIKEGSLKTLHPIYGDLSNKEEIKNANKWVRFLEPKVTINSHYECKHLVFMKFVEDSALVVRKVSKIEGLQKLIPDSWVSPLIENVDSFLDWYTNQSCYEVIYSKSGDLLNVTSQIMNNEL